MWFAWSHIILFSLGSASNVTDELPWIEPLCDVLRHARSHGKALFGICFGHQVRSFRLCVSVNAKKLSIQLSNY
jgi:GMP synthase-like glutamine amidotransferase